MCEELSYQIINTSAVNHKLSFVIIRSLQNHYRKENNSAHGCKQGRDTLF